MNRILSSFSAILFLTTTLPALAGTNDNTSKTLSGLHNARYCEVVVIKRHLYKMNASIYNTIDLNNCPAALWNKLDVAAIEKQFSANIVKLNGPRYFMMDSIVASNKTTDTPLVTIGGIQFKSRANITTAIWEGTVGDKLYTPNTVQRYTVFVYNPGTTIYELISPEGDAYVMQSYSQIIDPNLSITDLPNLAQKLKLPAGWKYQTRTLDKTLNLKANGIAYVINDDLYNSYQKE